MDSNHRHSDYDSDALTKLSYTALHDRGNPPSDHGTSSAPTTDNGSRLRRAFRRYATDTGTYPFRVTEEIRTPGLVGHNHAL